MDAPPGQLRSPDGLWWWDGKGWQPVATLGAPPSPPDSWQPPAEVASPAPPPAKAPLGGAWEPPSTITSSPPPAASTPEVASSGAWQPPGTSQPPPAESGPAIPEASVADPGPVWDPPSAPPPAPGAASLPPGATWRPPPVIGTRPPPAAAPLEPGAPWPNWLPRNQRSGAVGDYQPDRVDPGAANPPPVPITRIVVPAGARTSSWVEQLYPAGAALNSNRKLVAYVGLGLLGLIAVYVLLQVLSQANLFGARGGGATPQDTSPTGSQFQQADGFLSGSLNPALASLATTVNRIPLDCGGTHSTTCRNTLEDADTSIVKAIAIIDKGNFPGCIAAPVVQSRHDLVSMEQAFRAALIGFRANSDGLVTKGLADFTAAVPTLKTDGEALKAAEQSGCPKTP